MVIIGSIRGHGHFSDVVNFVAVPGADLVAIGVEYLMVPDGDSFLCILGVESVGELGIMSDAVCIGGVVDHAAPGVVRTVAAEGERNTKAISFSDGLESVEQIQLHLGFPRQSRDVGEHVHVVDLVPHRSAVPVQLIPDFLAVQNFIDEREVSKRTIRTTKAGKGQGASLLSQRHLGYDILGPLLDGQTPVFVDIQFAVFVKVLEVKAVNEDEQVLVLGAEGRLSRGTFDVIEAGCAFLDDGLCRREDWYYCTG